jgi:hypothetical protein
MSDRRQTFARPTSEIPNRCARVVIGSDHINSYSFFREILWTRGSLLASRVAQAGGVPFVSGREPS